MARIKQSAMDELRRYIDAERLRDPEMLSALEAQGIDTSDLDDGEDEEESDEFATESDAESDASLDELQRESDTLVATDRERRKRDRLVAEEDSLAASQQRLADELQRQTGALQQARMATTAGVRGRVNALTDRVGSLATPGGLGVPLLILFALLVFLIPVLSKSGESQPRFIWAWLVLTRKAKLLPESEVAPVKHEPPTLSEINDVPTVAISNNQNGHNKQSAQEAAATFQLPSIESSTFNRYLRG